MQADHSFIRNITEKIDLKTLSSFFFFLLHYGAAALSLVKCLSFVVYIGIYQCLIKYENVHFQRGCKQQLENNIDVHVIIRYIT